MTQPAGQYAFVPWLKTGVGAEISRVDGTAGSEPRVTVPVKVRFNNDPGLEDGVNLELFGPGEVQVFETLTVVRTWPLPGVMDAEANYFAIVEFDQADAAWRYTPARATSGDRLTPWVTLIVLEDSEIKRLISPVPERKQIGAVEINDAKALPRSSQLWAWAHVQVSGETSLDENQASQLMAARSNRIRSRLVAPRRLQPFRGYHALIVPVFQRGVLHGLGQDPGTIDALTRAWGDTPGGPMTLPVYFQWRFGTGPDGDFESLARLLKPFEAPDSIGIRDMDVSAASPGFPPANAGPLGLRGMLTALNTPETNWPAAPRSTWIAKLKALLNLPADRAAISGTPRTVTPPLYGQWPAATDRCNADVQPERPLWFQELNVDPRLRVGGGLGTKVIQQNQESLMASAWDQVDRVRQLNEELRQAQLAREMALRLSTRHVFQGETESVMLLTAPLHSRVKASPTTVRSVLNESPIPRGIFEGAFRRITRPLGPIGRRQDRVAAATKGTLLARLNDGTLNPAPPPPLPAQLETVKKISSALAPAGMGDQQVAQARNRARWLRIFGWIAFVLALVFLLLGIWIGGIVAVAVGATLQLIARQQAATADDLGRRVAVRDGQLSGDLIRNVTPPSDYAPQAAPEVGAPRTLPTTATASAASITEVNALKTAFGVMLDAMKQPQTPIRVFQQVNLEALRTTLTQKLNPRLTIEQAYAGRYLLNPAADTRWRPDDPLEQIQAAPEFPQAMYRPLAALNNEWLLPGFQKIPPNSATLLKSNQRMIEAYMVGLNHEMARELLWREYPTTQRATYFRQFWDTAGYATPDGGGLTPDELKDIKPIHTWRPETDLKDHSPRPPVAGSADYLVLFIRGDLLRRYPKTDVYANRAMWGKQGREIDDPQSPDEAKTKTSHPLFSGFMEPDANFFGFALTKEQVLGSDSPNDNNPGWYFVLAEPIEEPRFGMDEPEPSDPDTAFGLVVPSSDTTSLSGSGWNNLNWSQMVGSRDELNRFLTIDLNASLPNTSSIKDKNTTKWHADSGNGDKGSRSSDVAYITLQRPMRVAFHASEMIP